MRKLLLLIFFFKIIYAINLDLTNENISKIKNIKENRAYFGELLFKGEFKKSRELRYNSNYILNIGDKVSIKLWGAYNYTGELKIDLQGNIFIPKVGVVHLLGVSNKNLKSVVERSVNRVFNSNVNIYANLDSYQAISIFITGKVKKPGLYSALAGDSILQLLDKAGGVINGEGSYRDLSILRDNRVVKRVDLYNFLLDGNLIPFQFHNGDVIRVGNIKNRVEISGEVEKNYIFEFLGNSILVDDIIRYISVKPNATHFIVTKWIDGLERIKKYPISDRYSISLENGDKIRFVSDYLKDNITIYIAGEHANLHSIMVKKGENLKDLLSKIILTPLSDIKAVQLYRKSIALKQAKLIRANLKDLEARVMTTGSSTLEEAKIRKEESALVLDFIKRASEVKPKGQVIINSSTDLSNLILEDGDRVFIPKKSQVIVVEGEVSLPNAQTFVPNYTIEDYINSCGGFSPRADKKRVLIVKKSGRVITYNATSWWSAKSVNIKAGDSILILGKVDSKDIQITSSITQILYQIAVSTAVVLKAF